MQSGYLKRLSCDRRTTWFELITGCWVPFIPLTMSEEHDIISVKRLFQKDDSVFGSIIELTNSALRRLANKKAD